MANYYDDIEITRKQMITAMSYPLIIMQSFSLIVVIFILLFVIPKFEEVYQSAGAELNQFTLLILNTKYLEVI